MNRCVGCDAPKGKACRRWRDVWYDTSGNMFVEMNAAGQTRPLSGCFYDIVVKVLMDCGRSVNSAAAAVESHRNVVAAVFQQMTLPVPKYNGGEVRLVEHDEERE